MIRLSAFLPAVLLAGPALAQAGQPALSLEQRMQVRCSAVFALVAGEQRRGVAAALAYPPLGERGKEYFARAGARLMDELRLSREQVEATLRGEAETLRAQSVQAADRAAFVDGVMQPCLIALDASGL